jgi:divalent metal cation (Fe/Co/Zn/Cd) transporter
VLLEDLGALVGLFLALGGVTLSAVTDDAMWDGVGSLCIGTLLVIIAIILVIEMSSLLLGEAARPEVVANIRAALLDAPDVQRCIHLRTEHLGPDDIIVATKVEFDHTLTFEQLAECINAAEARVRAAAPSARLIFIEPDVFRTGHESEVRERR